MSASKLREQADATTIDDLAEKPEEIIRLRNNEMFAIPVEEQRSLHLKAARLRFEQLVDSVAVLGRLADEQNVRGIATLDDLGTLLVPHSASKSYPISFIECGRFDRLTNWLQSFTSHDLGSVDVSGCETIDEWIDALDRQSALRVVHSTGTSGKLSFLARDEQTSRQYVPGYERQFDTFRDERPLLGSAARETPVLYLQHRQGAYGQQRMLDALQRELFGGDSSMIVTVNPGRLSADAISLGGRLRAAEAKGDLGQFELGAKLLKQRDAFVAQRDESEMHLQAFLDTLDGRFRDRTVAIMGHLPQLFRLASAGLARGLEAMFTTDSFVAGGGGLKGIDLPPDWREVVQRFLGAPRLTPGYGMSELVGSFRPCAMGHFHLPPWVIPFILDPGTGQQAPRTGVQKGRFGALDLNASNYWGGFISGDEVTLSWGDSAPCQCGRLGPHIASEIRRYSESEGGDDKITCAGAPQAYDRALEYLVRTGG